MKALAIDSAVTCITLAACNNQKKVSLTLDIGMRQSEIFVPSIEQVLQEVGLFPNDLDFIVLSGGPGSFTGLRLGFAVAKALQLSTQCPVYAIPTLEAQALPYSTWPGLVISSIDAKKKRFYVQFFSNGQNISQAKDLEIEQILEEIEDNSNILLVGPDKELLYEQLKSLKPNLNVSFFPYLTTSIADALLYLGNKAFTNNERPLTPYQEPIYLRKSEAEENLR